MRRLEHIGLACGDLDESLAVWRDVMGRSPYKSEEVGTEGVRTHFLDAGSAKIELLEALSSDSPIAGFLDRRGPGVHHLAFEVDDLDEETVRMAALGYRLLGPPRTGADGKRITFLHPKDTTGVLVELCQQASLSWFEGETEGPCWLVPESPVCDSLALSLQRLGRVCRRVVGGSSLRNVAVVDPSPEFVESIRTARSGVVVWRTTPPSSVPADWLTIGIGQDGKVRFPDSLWEQLPDPWAVVAQLTAAHFRGGPG